MPWDSDIQKRMHKTTVEIDLDALEEAQRHLGTSGFKETLNRALEEVNAGARARQAAQYVAEGRMSMPTLEELREMRKPRF